MADKTYCVVPEREIPFSPDQPEYELYRGKPLGWIKSALRERVTWSMGTPPSLREHVWEFDMRFREDVRETGATGLEWELIRVGLMQVTDLTGPVGDYPRYKEP